MKRKNKKQITRLSNNTQKNYDSILEAFDAVNDALENAETTKEFADGANSALRYLSNRMQLTKRQCVMLGIFLDNCGCYSVSINQLARDMRISTTSMLRHWTDLDTLEERGFIVRCRGNRNEINYRMPIEVLECFKNDEIYIDPCTSKEKLTLDQLFQQLSFLFQRRDDEEISFAVFCTRIESLLKNNKQISFANQIATSKFDRDSKLLLLLACHMLVNDSDNRITQYDLGKVFDKQELGSIKRELLLGDQELQEAGLIEYNCAYGTVDRTEYRLTDKAKRELLAEVKMPQTEYRAGMTQPKDIIAKELFYNDEDARMISDLSSLLSEKNYKDICKRLKAKGLRQGFACLFYGSPGTGKTETVLQLAKQTGRNIMQIDISQMRSKWVGESEKNIKGVFDQYRVAVKKCKKAPILFFNEADAILNTRREGAQHAVDKMENAIQNILLEELEKLDGIFIATTNLANNLDPAFERRFLYKVNFHKPSVEARTKIWKTMLPDVPEEELHALASEFDFSGGQIENIARHYAIDTILYGENSFDKLRQFCLSERIDKRETRRVGFY